MARPVRFQYSGAVYHVMARGDGGKAIFETDGDRQAFIARLEEVCGSHGWQLHAWVLMGNHFHLLLETPQANLVSGMKWLLGTFSQGWNRSRLRRGHVFQGRYRSVPVNGSEADAYYFRIVADYIHLNPARAGLAGGDRGSLSSYRWSSLKNYASGNGPDWLSMHRVLRAFELAQDGRGRRAYVEWLEARALNEGGNISPEALAALKKGWYLGEERFRDKLLKLIEQPLSRRNKNLAGEAVRDRSIQEAERLAKRGSERLGLPENRSELEVLRKGDPRKVVLALLLRRCTTVRNEWIAERLAMGEAGSVSRLVGKAKIDKKMLNQLTELEEMLK